MKIAIIGGGAAGFFAAIQCASKYPDYQIFILEKSSSLLSKVKVSGGGRCNVTHACFHSNQLVKYYPRGEKFLKSVFQEFQVNDTIDWFKQRKTPLKIEDDGRMFPISDDSQTIIDVFLNECKRLKINILTQYEVLKILPQNSGQFELEIKQKKPLFFDKIILTTGGKPKIENWHWLKDLGLHIETPVPSLFTFNMPNHPIRELMGLSVPYVRTRVQGTKLEDFGPVLITHWGMSGPAILKLSAWGARVLHDLNYHFTLKINWLATEKENQVLILLTQYKEEWKLKQIKNCPFDLPKRLWQYFLEKLNIHPEKRWGELSKAETNRLNEILINDSYEVKGKTTFKEEFVTCGGVSLTEVEAKTMQSKKIKGLYFAGEVLNIDGVTGGFNFQAAWSTAFIAGQLREG